MLSLTVRNIKDVATDNKGNRICNYEVQVKCTDTEGRWQILSAGQVESFNRKLGWKELFYEALESVSDQYDDMIAETNKRLLEELSYEGDDI